MNKRDITNGIWCKIVDKEQFQRIRRYGILSKTSTSARVQSGEWCGPGKYYLLEYSQKCPRGCCYDDVRELLTVSKVVEEAKEKIKVYAQLLKAAKYDD